MLTKTVESPQQGFPAHKSPNLAKIVASGLQQIQAVEFRMAVLTFPKQSVQSAALVPCPDHAPTVLMSWTLNLARYDQRPTLNQ